ncbi:MAG TPA: 50S ribosomal protein L17 [Bacteroidetes bacterium]|nr:50S ribosomal protein L17 [Ignavibacteria bacterium]HCA43427.1 50S ribosomal protein L17 [Bacteroidota bacterium]HCN36098.1 50S ribosomal protein L17 [Bacteroidota bacterium]
MEHRKKGRKLKRTASHKKAMMSNMCSSLIKSRRIETTQAKAKELRIYIEPLVTKAKNAFKSKDSSPEKNVHLRRVAKSFLKDDAAVKMLFDEIGPMVGDRPGGYTRVIKSGFRRGDGGEKAIIEFVDFNYVAEKEKTIAEKEKASEDAKDSKKSKKESKAKSDVSSEKSASKTTKTKKTSKKSE